MELRDKIRAITKELLSGSHEAHLSVTANIIEEILIPLAKEAFEAGVRSSKQNQTWGKRSNEEGIDTDLKDYIKEKFKVD